MEEQIGASPFLSKKKKKKNPSLSNLKKYTEDLVTIYDRHPHLQQTQEGLWEEPGEPYPCSNRMACSPALQPLLSLPKTQRFLHLILAGTPTQEGSPFFFSDPLW